MARILYHLVPPSVSTPRNEVHSAEELARDGLPGAPVLFRSALERGVQGLVSPHHGALLLVPAQRDLGGVLVHVVAGLEGVIRAAADDGRRGCVRRQARRLGAALLLDGVVDSGEMLG